MQMERDENGLLPIDIFQPTEEDVYRTAELIKEIIVDKKNIDNNEDLVRFMALFLRYPMIPDMDTNRVDLMYSADVDTFTDELSKALQITAYRVFKYRFGITTSREEIF